MAEPKRNRIEREQALAQVAEMYLHGRTQASIGQELGVSQQQVSYDLKILQGRWQKSAMMNMEAVKARELAKVDTLEREYWQAWEASKGEQQRSVIEKSANADIPARARVWKENRNGDPRFLDGIQWCIERRCKILGIDAPTKVDMRVQDLDAAIDAELAKLATGSQVHAPLAAEGAQ